MDTYSVLPAGVSAATFNRALAAFRNIVGPGHVISTEAQVAPYCKVMLPIDEQRLAPSGVIMPATVEEIQRILVVCNHYNVPLWTISTGRNFGYGSAAPATRGQMVLDLKRMNRIIEVDPVLCTALVEPGVTYQQLQDYLKAHNLPLWIDYPGSGPIAGPLGNTLERGGGNTPYGDHFGMQCGMEVVLADGQVLRTGMGSIPNTTSWQVFKYGYGPYLDGMFTQSNYGIVTKLGFWLMPAPAAHRTIMVQYWDDADLERAVDTIRPLALDRTIQNVGVLANATIALTSFAKRAEVYQGPGAIPDKAVFDFASKHGVAPWNMLFSLYGIPEQIAVNLDIVTRAFTASGGKVNPDAYDPSQVNQLSMGAYKLYNWIGGGGSTWFAPVSPARGSDAVKQKNLAKSILGEYGFDYLAAPTLNGRDLHHLIALEFNRSDAAESKRAHACYAQLITRFAAAGYGIYRVSTPFMDQLADVYGPVKRDLNQKIKRALDPNGILAPGKSGIRI